MVLGHCYAQGRILMTQQIKTTKMLSYLQFSVFTDKKRDTCPKKRKEKIETHEGSYITNSSANSHHN